MTRTITTREYDALWEEALHNDESAYYWNGFEAGEKLPQRLGRGSYQFIQLRTGLSICIRPRSNCAGGLIVVNGFRLKWTRKIQSLFPQSHFPFPYLEQEVYSRPRVLAYITPGILHL